MRCIFTAFECLRKDNILIMITPYTPTYDSAFMVLNCRHCKCFYDTQRPLLDDRSFSILVKLLRYLGRETEYERFTREHEDPEHHQIQLQKIWEAVAEPEIVDSGLRRSEDGKILWKRNLVKRES